MIEVKRVVVWTLIILAIIAFWISIRSQENQMEYTLAALGLWGLSWLTNKFIKEDKRKDS